MEDIYDFFEEKRNFIAEKSNTNLEYNFDSKFLNFLSQLKQDLHSLGLLPFNWDIDGISVNVYENGDSYVLVDP